MKAARERSAVARQPVTLESSGVERRSPKQSASATSGTYFRAVRPSEQPATGTGGETIYESAKVEGLRFELEQDVWRIDAECTARRIIDDGEYVVELVGDE
jgi:hypothetical protein